MQEKSKILDILYGKIFTYNERIYIDRECHELLDKTYEKEESLREKLKGNAEHTKLFEEYLDCYIQANSAINDVYFAEGFKTGLLIGLEPGEWEAEKNKR